jgi:hypothetical protein
MFSKTFNSILANLKKKVRKKRQHVYNLTFREVRNWYGGGWQKDIGNSGSWGEEEVYNAEYFAAVEHRNALDITEGNTEG